MFATLLWLWHRNWCALNSRGCAFYKVHRGGVITSFMGTGASSSRRDVPVGVPLDLHELPKYNGIQVSQLI